MILDNYEQQGLLFNINFKSATSTEGLIAYRGEVVIEEGEVADASGRRKPPVKVLRDAVILADESKIKMLVGGLDAVAELPALIERFGSDIAEDAKVMLFAPNASAAVKTEVAGISLWLLPQEAMVWTLLCDEHNLRKGDFKGISPANKVLKVFNAFSGYSASYPSTALEDVLASATEAKRETRGAL